MPSDLPTEDLAGGPQLPRTCSPGDGTIWNNHHLCKCRFCSNHAASTKPRNVQRVRLADWKQEYGPCSPLLPCINKPLFCGATDCLSSAPIQTISVAVSARLVFPLPVAVILVVVVVVYMLMFNREPFGTDFRCSTESAHMWSVTTRAAQGQWAARGPALGLTRCKSKSWTNPSIACLTFLFGALGQCQLVRDGLRSLRAGMFCLQRIGRMRNYCLHVRPGIAKHAGSDVCRCAEQWSKYWYFLSKVGPLHLGMVWRRRMYSPSHRNDAR